MESVRDFRTAISELNKKFDQIRETVQNTVGRIDDLEGRVGNLEEWRNTYNND